MIHNIYLIHQYSGICLLFKQYGSITFNEDLVSGFLTALKDFSEEFSKGSGELKIIDMQIFYLCLILKEPMFIAASVDKNDEVKQVKKILTRIIDEFLEVYGPILKEWDAETIENNPSAFKGFEKTLDNISDMGKISKKKKIKIDEKSLLKLVDLVETSGISNESIQKVYDFLEESGLSEIIEVIKSQVEQVFLSYSTLDSEYFNIPQIARVLEEKPEIDRVFYWEKDSGENIVKFMEKNLRRCKTFILFCTENSDKSLSVEAEWESAFQLRQEGKIKIIPVYEDANYIPVLLKPILNVKFYKNEFEKFIDLLYKEILR
ncbi:MAG: toll/interleukin-1 receptor domain-containing protein [Candidatus Hermodarchaeota archaeon]